MEIHGDQTDGKFPVPAFCSMQVRVRSTRLTTQVSMYLAGLGVQHQPSTVEQRGLWGKWSVLLVHEYGQSELKPEVSLEQVRRFQQLKWILAILRPLTIETSSFGMDGRRVSRLLGVRLAGCVSALCTQVDDTVSCCDESCPVLTVDCGAASDDDVSTFRDVLTMYTSQSVRTVESIRGGQSDESKWPVICSCDTRRSFPLRGRRGCCCWSQDRARRAGRRRSWKFAFLFESPTVSDNFASGTEAAKQHERPRGIDETADSCYLFETRGGDHQSIGLQLLRIGRLVARWDSASDSAASNRSRSST
jgi:hypothetical protein